MSNRGTTQQCLEDFFGRYQWEQVQPFVAKYAGVEKSSVLRWKKGNLPVGLPLLKVRVMLDLLGYRVDEFKALPLPSQQFAKALAFDLIGPEEATETLGYEKTTSMYDMLLRNYEPQSFRWHRVEQWLAGHTKELDTAIRASQFQLGGLPRERGYEDEGSLPLPAHLRQAPPDEAPREPKPDSAAPEPEPAVTTTPQPKGFDQTSSMARALVHGLWLVSDQLDAINASPDKDKAIAKFRTFIQPEDVAEIVCKLDRLATTE